MKPINERGQRISMLTITGPVWDNYKYGDDANYTAEEVAAILKADAEADADSDL